VEVSYDDGLPSEKNKDNYFLPLPLTAETRIIAVVIPFYNENWGSLIATLRTLHQCYLKLNETKKIEICYLLVQDGWNVMDASMKVGLRGVFKDAEVWKNEEKVDLQTTIILQAEKDGKCARVRIPDLDVELYLALVLKMKNRKKHNSHEWFFSENGYCATISPEFCFATDCATQFHEDCLERLVDKMDKEESCAVCTGRQVVMTHEQQGGDPDTWIEWIYRCAQCYDFESSFSSFMGAFALFGFLPVVPGPCGLYRWRMMNGEPLVRQYQIKSLLTLEMVL
jgi:cellulose synthase/poly-beta-1,6-N-acetylglucosamine synthase-like glycosyltransferase